MNLPFNWFDVLLVIVLFVGLQRGRKRGMSEELMSLFKWLAIILGCAFLYQPIGDKIAESPVFGQLSGYLMAYFAIALIISPVIAPATDSPTNTSAPTSASAIVRASTCTSSPRSERTKTVANGTTVGECETTSTIAPGGSSRIDAWSDASR